MRHRRWLVGGVILIIIGIAGGYWFTRPQRQRLVAGTNVNPALTTQAKFYRQFTAQYPHLKPALDHDAKPDTYVIPGLQQTASLVAGRAGQLGVSKTMDPQGLTVTPQYVVISAYSRDKRYQSVLYFLAKQSGRFVKQIVLPDASHVGGLAYDPVNRRLWVTTETKEKTAALSAYDAATWQQSSFARSHHATPFDHVVRLAGVPRASFLTYHANALYVGYFNLTSQGNFLALPITRAGLPTSSGAHHLALRGGNQKAGHYATAKRLQGATFYHGKLLFSQSFGPKSSQVLAFDNDGRRTWLDFDGDDTIKTVQLPPYLEQITADGEDLYALFESAAAKYRSVDLAFHADRVVKLDLHQLLK